MDDRRKKSGITKSKNLNCKELHIENLMWAQVFEMMFNQKISEKSSMDAYIALVIWLIETYLNGMIG